MPDAPDSRTNESPNPPPRQPGLSRRWGILAALLALLGVVLIVWIMRSSGDPQPYVPPAITVDDLPGLLRLRQKSLAYLENQLPQDAVPLLTELGHRYPAERAFATYHVGLGRLLELELKNATADPSQFGLQIAATESSLGYAREDDPNSGVPALLLSRLYGIVGDAPAQIAAAEQATVREPDNPIFWFALFRALNDAEQTDSAAAPQTAIERVVTLDPVNVWALLRLLEQQVANQDAAISDRLAQLGKIISPLQTGIEQRTRVDPLAVIETATAAVQQTNWGLAERQIRLLGNIIRPEEIAQSDRNRLLPNTLEFIHPRFSPATELLLAENPPPIPAGPPVEFVTIPIAAAAGLTEVRALDVADLDLDGDAEICVLTDTEFVVLATRATSTEKPDADADESQTTNDWEIRDRFPVSGNFAGFVLADLDQDSAAETPAAIPGAPCALADLDLVLFGNDGLRIYENRLGNPTEDLPRDPAFLPREVTLENAGNDMAIRAVTAADFDLDGDLDLIPVDATGQIHLWRNSRDFQFLDVSARSTLPPPEFEIVDVQGIDLDRDVDLDLLLRSPAGIGYLENLRHGELRFRLIAAVDPPGPITALEPVDWNGDASWDLAYAAGGQLWYLPSLPSAPGGIRWQESVVITDVAAEAFTLIDVDNDGYRDLATSLGDAAPLKLWRRSGNVAFTAQNAAAADTASAPVQPLRGRPAVCDDLDNDGDLDLIGFTGDQIWWQRNDGGNVFPHLKLALHGQQAKGGETTASGRVNHYGWGSLVEFKAGPTYQARVADRQTLLFGLGNDAATDRIVRVVWPNGIPQNVIDPENNLFICEEQRLKGSCPYLYAWNGREIAFVTDLLWAAPVGLQFAEGVIAPTRAEEFLRIAPEAIQPRDGEYDLRVTEELWEAAYFDKIALFAVDHPAEYRVYTNEKVASSTPPEFRLFTVAEPRTPVRVTDQTGRDCLAEIAERDEIYLQPFDRKFFQGVTEPWSLEIDLGELPEDAAVTLFLTGWVYPTDTSLNVALGQNPDGPRPQPPQLQVPDENGVWQTIDPSCGFPGGKTKTIAIDLRDRFLTSDFRVRLASSMELSWDQIFFTVGAPDFTPEMTPLQLTGATVQPRGISQPLPHPQLGPERYDYNRLQAGFDWPPMRGPFTAYGEVADLLTEADDRLVVIPAGDEIVLRFAVPDAALPPGWTRTFVLHNVGYDKDADLHTVYGQSSTPYPTRDTATYPALPAEDGTESTIPAIPDSGAQRTLPVRKFWTQIRDR